jgi:glutamyl-tRNA synthetase
MADKVAPFFQESVTMDQEAVAKYLVAAVRPALIKLITALEGMSTFEHDAIEQRFKTVLVETSLSMSKLAQPVRVALTGGTVSPGIFDVMMLLGRDRTIARLKKVIDLIR